MIIFKVWGSETSAVIVKTPPTNTGQNSLIADVVSPCRHLRAPKVQKEHVRGFLLDH